MTKPAHSLRPDAARRWRRLDDLKPGAVIIDDRGHAWQEDRGWWYRAFDSDHPANSFNLAQRISGFKEVHRVHT